MNDYRAYVTIDYNSIYHHGIKGQKWGRRRYQNEDGSLTPEGRARYGKLINSMKAAGKSDKEIQDAISKRMDLEKKVKIGVGAAAAVAGGYLAYKHLGNRFIDKTIKKGDQIRTLTTDPTRLQNQHFYAAKGLHDENRYIGQFGRKTGILGLPIGDYKKQVTSKALEDVKIASERSSKKVFDELMSKDHGFRNSLVSKMASINLPDTIPQKKVKNGINIMKRIQKGSLNYSDLTPSQKHDIHTAFNYAMVDHNMFKDEHSKFFNALKNKGYGGLVDVNDNFYSGFNTKSAKIIFSNEKFMQTNIKQLSSKDVDKAKTIDMIAMYGEHYLPMLPAYAAIGGASSLAKFDKKAMTKKRTRSKGGSKK